MQEKTGAKSSKAIEIAGIFTFPAGAGTKHASSVSFFLSAQQRTGQAGRPASAIDAEFVGGKCTHIESCGTETIIGSPVFCYRQQAVSAQRQQITTHLSPPR